MEKAQKPKPICTSVFKNGENTTSKALFTKKWTEMINKIEKGKMVNLSQQ